MAFHAQRHFAIDAINVLPADFTAREKHDRAMTFLSLITHYRRHTTFSNAYTGHDASAFLGRISCLFDT